MDFAEDDDDMEDFGADFSDDDEADDSEEAGTSGAGSCH